MRVEGKGFRVVGRFGGEERVCCVFYAWRLI